LPEWTFDRKRISANTNHNPNSKPNPKPNPNFNPSAKAQKTFSGKQNDVIFQASIQIPL